MNHNDACEEQLPWLDPPRRMLKDLHVDFAYLSGCDMTA
jgi:hypothetical protein